MRVVYQRCAGMDVHKKTVVVCVMTPTGQETRTFRTMTAELRKMIAWLRSEKVQAIAMESTGVYWKPVWNVLEEEEEADWELLLVNAKHVKQVPGRKTDVKDAEWLAELLQHGLLNPSRVPEKSQRELRDMTRFRRTLIRQRAHEIQRLQKVLEGGNIKLDSVISDVVGVSGKAMIQALINGETDAATLAKLGGPRLKATPEQLKEALEGVIGEPQRVLLKILLGHIDYLDRQIERMDAEVSRQMDRMGPILPGGGQPSGPSDVAFDPETGEVVPETDAQQDGHGVACDAAIQPEGSAVRTSDASDSPKGGGRLTWSQGVELLDGIPGVGVRSAQDILAEIGLDMGAFPTSGHLTSWAKISPGNNESGGKRRSGRIGKGNRWLKSTLVEVSWSAVRVRDCYYKALYGRLSGRRGKKRAIVAVGRSLLETIYHMLDRCQPYHELGGEYLDWLRRDRIKHSAIRRLIKLGFDVHIQELAQAA